MRLRIPFENAMLSDAAGVRDGDCLRVDCVVEAQPGHSVRVNGAPALEAGPGRYLARAALTEYRNTLTLRDDTTGETVQTTLFWVPKATGMYRLSLDDNIWNLQDIAQHADTYKSIFEAPYLRLMRDVHDRYGTKILMNIYYQCPEHGGFTLAEMPDKYRDEFRANADWFRIGFHARQDWPAHIYREVDYDTLAKDITLARSLRQLQQLFLGEELPLVAMSLCTHEFLGNVLFEQSVFVCDGKDTLQLGKVVVGSRTHHAFAIVHTGIR